MSPSHASQGLSAFPPAGQVLVPVDFSEQSLQAVRVACGLVQSPAQLSIVHVLAPLGAMDPGVVWGAWSDDSRRQHAIEAVRSRLDEDLQQVHVHVCVGEPAREIADRASECQAELIVIPSHGRTGASRILIGSVAERVVRYAHCPVLVLRD